ncbi:MAG: multidrug ABC transporter ATP-binding protein [Clostridia bacterium]|nr:MAG: multidrug ABC transporter ATP-binding protein [Clostridia bacterium]
MIEIKNITKKYPGQKIPALSGVNLKIESGEFFGLLGPNGAGKTTMIKLLATLLIPNEGEIIVDGERLARSNSNIKRKLSMVTQEYSLRSNMTPEQIMELHGRLYQIPKNVIRERSAELLDFCGLGEHRTKICRQLSGGMKRKLMLSRGLLTAPEILILDEPTVGLDPFARRQMWDLLKQLNDKGMTILLTTHYIDEAQYLCRRIALIDKGKTDRVASPRELIDELGATAVDEFDGSHIKSSFFAAREEALHFAGELENEFVIRSTTLEDVFVTLIGRKLEGK